MIKKAMRKLAAPRAAVVAKGSEGSAGARHFKARALPPPVAREPRGQDGPAWVTLMEERQRVRDEIAHQELLIQDRPTTTNHLADNASDVTEQAMSLALHCHLEALLKEIERAMVRVERGTYGLCERCGKRIDAERLRIVPSAALCIECAKRQAWIVKTIK